MKEPGYTYDLFFLFLLYFNQEHFLKHGIHSHRSEEDTKFYERLLFEFGSTSEDLLPFFYFEEKKHVFLTDYYFHPYKKSFCEGTYSLATVLEELSNYDRVVENVLRYYFKKESDETIQKCKGSLTEANKLIRASKYDGRIKSALYAFLIDPVPTIELLSRELTEKERAFAKRYEQSAQALSTLEKRFDLEDLNEKLKQQDQRIFDLLRYERVDVSFCFYNKDLIRAAGSQDTLLLQLGADYEASLQNLLARYPKLHEFGLALSEENRVAILNFIHQHTEVTIKELEHALEMAGTNTYYHLAIMVKAGLLKTRNKGRTILYSINTDYLGSIADAITLLARGKEDEEENKEDPPEHGNRF